MATALFVAAGDREERCRRSVRRGWRTLETATPFGIAAGNSSAGETADLVGREASTPMVVR